MENKYIRLRLPTCKRFDKSINTISYNVVNNACRYYLNEIFELAPHCTIGTRNILKILNFLNLKILLAKHTWDKKQYLILVPSIWNRLSDSIKKSNSLNTFKHNVKKHYLTWITHIVFMWIRVSLFIYVYMSVGVCIYTYAYILVRFPLTYSFSWFVLFCFLVYPFLSFPFKPEGPKWK